MAVLNDRQNQSIQKLIDDTKSGSIVMLRPGMEYCTMDEVYHNDQWLNQMQNEQRRLKRYSVTAELLCSMFIIGTKDVRIIDGIPTDAVVKSGHFNNDTECFDFIVWHSSFDIVPVDTMLPQGNINMREEAQIHAAK